MLREDFADIYIQLFHVLKVDDCKALNSWEDTLISIWAAMSLDSLITEPCQIKQDAYKHNQQDMILDSHTIFDFNMIFAEMGTQKVVIHWRKLINNKWEPKLNCSQFTTPKCSTVLHVYHA